ncbi:MAG: hypothetical protein ACYC9Q_13575, partial [Bacillota bacterium]
RKKYPLNELFGSLSIPKSSYFYQCAVLSAPDKYSELRERVRAPLLHKRVELPEPGCDTS